MNILLRENSWLARLAALRLGTEKVAMVLGKTIHLHGVEKDAFLRNDAWVKHEMAHVEQYHRYGFFKFILLYLWYSIRFGYHRNPLEVEARARQNSDESIRIVMHASGNGASIELM